MPLPSLQSIFMRAKQDHLHSIIYSALRYCIRITCTGGVYTRLHQLQSGLEGIIWTALPYSRARQRYENRHQQGDLLGIECEESFELMSRQHLRYIGNLQENLKDQHHTKPPFSFFKATNIANEPMNCCRHETFTELCFSWNWISTFLCGKDSKLGFDFMLANGKCMERWY